MLSRSKAPKTQQICHYRHARKTSELFLLFNAGVDLSLCNNFANSGSFTKVSVPVHNYNSLCYIHSLLELSLPFVTVCLLLFSYNLIHYWDYLTFCYCFHIHPLLGLSYLLLLVFCLCLSMHRLRGQLFHISILC